jgi:hypothetical protein
MSDQPDTPGEQGGEQRGEPPVVGSATTGYNPDLTEVLSVTLPIVDIHCATCVQTIERVLRSTEGVRSAHVNYALGEAHVVYEPGLIIRTSSLT